MAIRKCILDYVINLLDDASHAVLLCRMEQGRLLDGLRQRKLIRSVVHMVRDILLLRILVRGHSREVRMQDLSMRVLQQGTLFTETNS